MAKVIGNCILPEEIIKFIDFLEQQDGYIDDRGHIRNKVMTPSQPGWPINEVKSILDRILDYDYVIESADFRTQTYQGRPHVDSGETEEELNGHAILIPLKYSEDNYTVFFNNRWNGPKAKFSKNFTQEKEENLSEVSKRNKKIFGNQPINDYKDIINISMEDFDKDEHQKWLSHIKIEDLKGFTLESVLPWKLGSAIVWDRNQIHTGTHFLSKKTFLTIFTTKNTNIYPVD